MQLRKAHKTGQQINRHNKEKVKFHKNFTKDSFNEQCALHTFVMAIRIIDSKISSDQVVDFTQTQKCNDANPEHCFRLVWDSWFYIYMTQFVDSTVIDKNGWFVDFQWPDWLILLQQRINILDDACNFGPAHSHFGNEKQRSGSQNQQNGITFQQSGSQKHNISCYISTSGV